MSEYPEPIRAIHTASEKTLSQRITSFSGYGTSLLVIAAIGMALIFRPNYGSFNLGIFFFGLAFAGASSYIMWLISQYVALQEENNRNLKQIIEKLNK